MELFDRNVRMYFNIIIYFFQRKIVIGIEEIIEHIHIHELEDDGPNSLLQ